MKRWLLTSIAVFVLIAVLLYSTFDLIPRTTLTSAHKLKVIGFAPDNRSFATVREVCDLEGNCISIVIDLWDVATGHHRYTLPLPWLSVRYAGFSPDSHWFAAHGRHQEFVAWDMRNGSRVFETKDIAGEYHMDDIGEHGFQFSPDGRAVIVGVPKKLLFVDTSTWKCCWDLPAPTYGSYDPGSGGLVPTFDTSKVSEGDYRHFTFTPDGKFLLCWLREENRDMIRLNIQTGETSASGKDAVHLLDVRNGKVLHRFSDWEQGHFSQDSRCLVLWNDHALQVHDIVSGDLVTCHEFGDGFLENVWWSSDTKNMMTLIKWPELTGKCHLVTWRFDRTSLKETKRVTCNCGGLSSGKNSFAFQVLDRSTDPSNLRLRLFVESLEHNARKELATLPQFIHQFEFTNNNRALGTDAQMPERSPTIAEECRDWLKQCLGQTSGNLSEVEHRQLIARTLDLRLWDVETGKQIAALPGHYSMGFSPDGRTLATLDPDNAVHFWDVPPRRPWLAILGYATLPASLVGCFGWWRTRRLTKESAPKKAASVPV